MRQRFSFAQLFILVFVVTLVVVFIQLGVISVVLGKLGLSPHSALTLLAVFLFGSAINLPLFSIDAEEPETKPPKPFRGLLPTPDIPFTGKTRVAINVGGGLTPILFSIYLFTQTDIGSLQALIGIAVVSAVSYVFSRPVPGLGIGMPIFIAPVTAALTAVILSQVTQTPESSAPLAYISGTLGVLIGADILRLKDIRKMGTPVAAIGGAGTFDGIFITGIAAVLLA